MCRHDPVEVKKLRIEIADLQQAIQDRDDEIAQLNGVVENAQDNQHQLESDLYEAQNEVDRLTMKLDQRTPRAYIHAATLVSILSGYLFDEVEACDDPGHRHRLFDVLQERDYRLGDAVYSVDKALKTNDEFWLRIGPGADLPRKYENNFSWGAWAQEFAQ